MKPKENAILSVFTISVGAFLASGCSAIGNRAAEMGKLNEQISGGKWRVLGDIPVERFGGAAAVVNGRLHLFGGVNMNPHTPEG